MGGDRLAGFQELRRQAARDQMRRGRKADRSCTDDDDRQALSELIGLMAFMPDSSPVFVEI